MEYLQRLVALRKERKISQLTIAELLMTTQQQISKYEKGKQELPIRHLFTLADFYGVSLDYIAGRTNVKSVNK